MAYRTLELTLISAKDLNDVNIFSKMDVYAVATIAGDPRTQQRTPVDRNGGKNPSWNASLRFPVPSDPAAAGQLVIDVVIRSDRVFGDRDIGEVHIPLKEFLEGHKEGSKFVSYQVRKPHSGKAKGVLNLSYKFVDLPATTAPPPPAGNPVNTSNTYPPPAWEKGQNGNEPVMAYPAAGASGSAYPPSYPPAGGYPGGYPPYPPQGGYPAYPQHPQAGQGFGAPQPAGYGYGAPPLQGYGYGAPPPGYGYGAPPSGYGGAAYPQKNNKNNLGLGLGAGLIGGAIGGMLIGDMISDDGGFGDGFGF